MNGVWRVLDSAGHVETGISLQHNAPCVHAGTLSIEGVMKVLEGPQ